MVDLTQIGTSIIEPLLKWLTYATLLTVALVAFYLFYKQRNYRYTCLIYTKRAEGQSSLSKDKGGYFKLAGDTWIFKLRKSKHAKINPPDNKFIWKAGKGDIIHFRNLGENQYIPFNPAFKVKEEEDYLMDVNYDENLSWYLSIVDFIKQHFDWKTFWDKYGAYVVILTLVMFTIIVIYLNFQWISQEMGKAEGISSALNRFVDMFGNRAPEGAVAP